MAFLNNCTICTNHMHLFIWNQRFLVKFCKHTQVHSHVLILNNKSPSLLNFRIISQSIISIYLHMPAVELMQKFKLDICMPACVQCLRTYIYIYSIESAHTHHVVDQMYYEKHTEIFAKTISLGIYLQTSLSCVKSMFERLQRSVPIYLIYWFAQNLEYIHTNFANSCMQQWLER